MELGLMKAIMAATLWEEVGGENEPHLGHNSPLICTGQWLQCVRAHQVPFSHLPVGIGCSWAECRSAELVAVVVVVGTGRNFGCNRCSSHSYS